MDPEDIRVRTAAASGGRSQNLRVGGGWGGSLNLDRGDVEVEYKPKSKKMESFARIFFNSICSQRASPIIIWNPHP